MVCSRNGRWAWGNPQQLRALVACVWELEFRFWHLLNEPGVLNVSLSLALGWGGGRKFSGLMAFSLVKKTRAPGSWRDPMSKEYTEHVGWEYPVPPSVLRVVHTDILFQLTALGHIVHIQ